MSNALAAPLTDWSGVLDGQSAGPSRAALYGERRDRRSEVRGARDRRLLDSGHIEHPGQVAVLYRTNAQARTRGAQLAQRQTSIPCARRRGPVSRDRRSAISSPILRLAHCHRRRAGAGAGHQHSAATAPRHRAGAAQTAGAGRRASGWAQKRGGPTARRAVEELLAFLEDLHRDTHGQRPAAVLQAILQRVPYREWLQGHKDGDARLKAVEHLRSVMETSAAPDLGTWLIDMQLGEFDGPTEAGAKSVTLTTIHGAKGGEWPVVFVVGCEEGLLPHGRLPLTDRSTRAEDEERRLAYVAFSRAQVLLYLVHCRARRLAAEAGPGRLEPRQPSRFVLGLPAELIERVDGRAA